MVFDLWRCEFFQGGTKKGRPQRSAAKKRQHSEEEEDEDEEEEEEDEEEDEDDDESDSDSGKKPKKKRRAKKDEDEDEDSDDNSFNEPSGIPPKDYTVMIENVEKIPFTNFIVFLFNFQSGAFVVAKADITGDTDPTLWRIDGKALLQKYLPIKEDDKTVYKSTSTYSGWSVNNKDKYVAAQVTFKVQNRHETVVELHLDQQQQQEIVKSV